VPSKSVRHYKNCTDNCNVYVYKSETNRLFSNTIKTTKTHKTLQLYVPHRLVTQAINSVCQMSRTLFMTVAYLGGGHSAMSPSRRTHIFLRKIFTHGA